MKRRTVYVLVFVLVTGSLLLYNVVLPYVTVAPTSCPAIFADLSMSSSGFAYSVGAPWFSPPQLVLAPGTAGTIILAYTSPMNNLSQMYQQPHGAFGFEYEYLFPVGSSNPVSINSTGVAIFLSNATFPTIHDADFSLVVNASAAARQGAYELYFPSTCGSTFYLVVGNFPYLLPTPGVLSPLSLILFDVLMGLLSVAVAYIAFVLYGRRAGAPDTSPGLPSSSRSCRT